MGRSAKRAHVHGVVPVDKPKGWSSHDVVARMRRVFEQRQVGHSGTLDPMATGALVVLLGEATKLSRFIQAGSKTYTATVALGVATSSDDADGEVVERADVPSITKERAVDVLASFIGEHDQVPPAVSAIKVDGKRSYRRVRNGEVVELAPRRVHCFEAELLELGESYVRIQVRVAAGYYVRSLGRDLAAQFGTVGHLSSLRRIENAGFPENALVSVRELEASVAPETFVRPMLATWPERQRLWVNEKAAKALSHGKRVLLDELQPSAALASLKTGTADTWAAICGAGAEPRLVALVERVDAELRVVRGFSDDAMLGP